MGVGGCKVNCGELIPLPLSPCLRGEKHAHGLDHDKVSSKNPSSLIKVAAMLPLVLLLRFCTTVGALALVRGEEGAPSSCSKYEFPSYELRANGKFYR